MLIQFKLVCGPFRQSNMHSTLDFCPRPARKETNVTLHKNGKLRGELTVLTYILCYVALDAMGSME